MILSIFLVSVVFANPDCWDDHDAYTGIVTKTKGGRECKNWNKVLHHGYSPSIENNNYCRSKVGENPWCYTTDPGKEWEFLDVVKISCVIYHHT